MICDYCDAGIPIKDGWHEIPDPEGVEGTARVFCANALAAEYRAEDEATERLAEAKERAGYDDV
jgi:hypothetical protein